MIKIQVSTIKKYGKTFYTENVMPSKDDDYQAKNDLREKEAITMAPRE